MVTHPFVIVYLSQIAGSVVWKNDYKYISFFQVLFGIFQSSMHCGSTGPTYKKPFLSCQATRHDRSILVSHLDEVVNQGKIHIRRQNIFSNSFSEVWIDFLFIKNPRLLVFLKHRTVGIQSYCDQVWVLFFQILGCTTHGTASANSSSIVRDPSIRIFPDFGSRGFVMRLGIGEVIVLVGVE